MKNNKWLNIIGLVSVIIIIFIIGFYFGYKNAKASEPDLTKTVVTSASNNLAQPSTELKAIPVDGVFWIKTGQEPVCDKNHPIKGTFADNFGNFYTPDNSRYDRIKADICFATEEYARDSAGFIKKF
jgi:hypothetical protein